MSELVKSVELDNGNTLEIYTDSYPSSPRGWDNLGMMFIKHRNYDFGDSDLPIPFDKFEDWAGVEYYIESTLKAVVCLPIYMYVHGGATINTTGFSCRWDSGQVGFIYTTNQQLGKMGLSPNDGEEWDDFLQRIKEQLIGEVKVMDQYISGETYSYRVIDAEGTEEESCSGFFGDDFKTNGILDNIEGSPVNMGDL